MKKSLVNKFKYSARYLLLLFLTVINISVYAHLLSDVKFSSFGIHKTEELIFISDSICLYKQTWDSIFEKGPYQYTDTFLYHYYDTIEIYGGNRIERIVIKNINTSKLIKNPKRPINEDFHYIMDFSLPKYIPFWDVNESFILLGKMRRSQYNMWDINYPGKKTRLSTAYALLYTINNDTLNVYDNKVIYMNNNGVLLYASDSLESILRERIQSVTESSVITAINSYEYQRYCYHKKWMNLSLLNTDSLNGHTFSYIHLNDNDSILKETLEFTKDDCIYKQDNDNKILYAYDIKDGLIILKNKDDIDVTSNKENIETLAYNDGFIFYAKLDTNRVLNIKVFREDKEKPKLRRNKKWKIFNPQHKTYPLFEKFDSICYETYIPINF